VIWPSPRLPRPHRTISPRLNCKSGACWTKSEPILSKIQTPTDAKLLRNFANGSRAKIFLPLNPSNFCPLAKIFVPPFQFLNFIHITSGIYEVFLERSGRKIWVRGEPRAEPYIPCYTPRRPKGGERSGARGERKQVEKFFYPCFKVKPPSTTSISPVTESAVARYRKASAISST